MGVKEKESKEVLPSSLNGLQFSSIIIATSSGPAISRLCKSYLRNARGEAGQK
jgi:hypothetical protein